MSKVVKTTARGRGAASKRQPARAKAAPTKPPVSKTKISSKHQVTIGKQAFDQAGFQAGDVVAVRAVGPGRVELSSLDALFAKYRGQLSGGGAFRRDIEQMRDEWA
jgi:bifunctional DNA-binding transcriptional regulator/antitoxin component of YhaV-PrlF toxin-antitoxin module